MSFRYLIATLFAGAHAHAGLTTPPARNSFGQPLHKQGMALPHTFSNYYDDGCLVGCRDG